MSALGRLLARLLGRRPAPPPRFTPFTLGEAEPAPPFDLGEVEPAPSVARAADEGASVLSVEPRSELAVTPALGAASGEAEVIAATAGVALVDEAAPTADDEDVFEEEERAEDASEDPGRVDLDDKIAARAAAVPYLRQVAEEEALGGEHRVRPTDPSGPGTLAEALSRLEAQGRLTCDLEEDAEGAPILVYRPIPAVH